ncbi:MAG: nucleotidyltransferase [Lachnospiraceae bacterium]|nr:nucleotidyltransferase [Lachnospiraceae bacterium]
MKKPILVVMAAGMGSRYGGLKQIDPVGPHGEVIMDYSLYDAKRAGFERVIFVIKHSIEEEFRKKIGDHAAHQLSVEYAFQDLEDLPEGYSVPAGREKPWGTCHAVLAARKLIDAPFAVINADDYYGTHGFQLIYDYLTSHTDDEQYRYSMVGYLLKNTVTANGSVARGLCTADENGHLISVIERTQIETYEKGIHYTEDGGATWTDVSGDTPVSMNFWGFTESFIREAWAGFPAFLDEALASDPIRSEYFLPSVVEKLLHNGRATIEILSCPDKWYGVTYRNDKPEIVRALQAMTTSGIYPAPLWS